MPCSRQYIAAKTLEYMTAMEAAPRLKASGLDGDYRILADFGDAVLAGHPTERGVQFVTWEWDWDRKGVHHGHYFQNGYEEAKHDFVRPAGLLPRKHCSTRTTRRDTSGIGFRLRAGRSSIYRKGKGNQDHHGADQVPIAGISGTDADNGTKCMAVSINRRRFFCRRNHKMKYESDRRSSPLFAPTPPREETEPCMSPQ